MPKRNSESSPMKREADIITKEKKTPLMSKKTGSEIDEIFAVKKRKKTEKKKTTKRSEEYKDMQSMKPTKKKEKQSEDGRQVDSPRKPRKRTGDGLAIFTEDEL